MTLIRHLSWENFHTTVFLPGEQRVHRVLDTPILEVFGDGIGNRIGLLLQVPANTVVPPELSKLAVIRVRTFEKQGSLFLEVTTATASLHRQFYHFVIAVAERVAVENRAGLDAVRLELQCFTDLIEQKPILSMEKQIGLVGELVFLQYLVVNGGNGLLDSWVGPLREPHDFRISDSEFEVKTTVATQRVHTINGIEQLVPSKNCSLHLVSVLLGPPGAGLGFSLKSVIDSLSGRFTNESLRLAQFTKLLEAYGYRSEDSPHYQRQFTLRRPIAVAGIATPFPAITRPVIQLALGNNAQRVEALQYDVNIEGLEHESGSPEFERVVTERIGRGTNDRA